MPKANKPHTFRYGTTTHSEVRAQRENIAEAFKEGIPRFSNPHTRVNRPKITKAVFERSALFKYTLEKLKAELLKSNSPKKNKKLKLLIEMYEKANLFLEVYTYILDYSTSEFEANEYGRRISPEIKEKIFTLEKDSEYSRLINTILEHDGRTHNLPKILELSERAEFYLEFEKLFFRKYNEARKQLIEIDLK